MARVMLLLLLPGLLWAQAESKIGSVLTVKQSAGVETVKQPTGTIERVGLRTANSLTFERGKIGSGVRETVISPCAPLCWRNPATGHMERIDLSARAAVTKGYQRLYRFGPSSVELDSLGNMLYEKDGMRLIVHPLFRGVKMVLEPQPTQLKATYVLERADTLHWRLDDPHRMAGRKILPFSAVDAAGRMVDLIEERTDTSLCVALKSAKGVSWPVLIDPTIQDTSVTALNKLYRFNNADFNTARAGATANFTSNDMYVGADLYSGSYYIWRSFLSFSTGNLWTGGTLDSVHLSFTPSTIQGLPQIYALLGSFSGAPADGWFNDFTTVKLTSLCVSTDSVMRGTQALVDTLTSKMGRGDTLRMVLMDSLDLLGGTPPVDRRQRLIQTPILTIYYTIVLPTLTTQAGSATVSAILVGEITSTGGGSCTARGHQWWVDADTTTVSKAGVFAVGTYADSVNWLPQNSTIKYRSFATNAAGTSYGSVQTFSTGAGGSGGGVIVDGRAVNTRR